MVVGAVLGVSFGYYLTPEYKVSMYEKNTMSLGQADRTFDLRYVNAMISHHRGAMLLAEQLGKNTVRPEMKTLSQNILMMNQKLLLNYMLGRKTGMETLKQ